MRDKMLKAGNFVSLKSNIRRRKNEDTTDRGKEVNKEMSGRDPSYVFTLALFCSTILYSRS